MVSAERNTTRKEQRERHVANADDAPIVVVETCSPDVEPCERRKRSVEDRDTKATPCLRHRVAHFPLRDGHERAEEQAVRARQRDTVDELRNTVLDPPRLAREPPLEQADPVTFEREAGTQQNGND